MPDMIHNVANYLHVLAALSLLMKFWTTGDCAGISGKSQLLYVMVYTTRYLDLFTTFISRENTMLKIIYLTLGYLTVFTIFIFCRKTYEKKYDTFRIELLLTACLAIAYFVNHYMSALEILWTFSIYLESVAMLPQFQFISKAGYVHKHVFYYILALGTYKSMYLVHWVYRYYEENHYDKLAVASGFLQFLFYCDFFLRILPRLQPKPRTEEQQDQIPSTSLATDKMESGISEKNGHLGSNIGSVVLTPATLTCSNSDKEILLKEETATNNRV